MTSAQLAAMFLPRHSAMNPSHTLADGRWRATEWVFWAVLLAAYFVFPERLVLGSQILITALFALSLDLILGYAGIASLGHAAFFGIGAYTAGLLAKHGMGEPLSGLALAAVAAGLVGFVVSFLIVRGTDLTRLMVTMAIGMVCYEAANKAAFITGGVDGLMGVVIPPLFDRFEFNFDGKVAYLYSLAVVFVMFWLVRRVIHSPFGLSLRGIREGGARMPAIGAPVRARLVAVFTLAAAVAGVAGGLMAQTTQFVALDSLSFSRSAELLIILVLGGAGRLYGAFVGALVFMVMQSWLSDMNPVYWQFWIGLLLVVIVLFARGGILGGVAALHHRLRVWAGRADQ
ncbi:MAG: branched-chain amino acid ABC transporter permease [Rhodocyclaceae bacterium]